MTIVRYQAKPALEKEIVAQIIELNRKYRDMELKFRQEEQKRLALQKESTRLKIEFSRILTVNRVLASSIRERYMSLYRQRPSQN